MLLAVTWMTMTSISDEEQIDVWAYTPDFNLIIVEDEMGEPIYGLQNRHTYVIEIREPIFSNAINYLIQLQDEYDAAYDLINEDGSLRIDDMIKVTYKTKKGDLH